MKISIDGVEIFTLSETQKKVIQNDINVENFFEDIAGRLQYILSHKYERCHERMVKEYMPILENRVQSIPTNKETLAELIMAQPEYKNRSQRDAEEKAKRNEQEANRKALFDEANRKAELMK